MNEKRMYLDTIANVRTRPDANSNFTVSCTLYA